MEKSFWIGTHVKNFLFGGYDLTSIWGLVATCIGAFSLAILYEGGKKYKLHCKSQIFTTAQELSDSTADTATLMTSCSGTTSNRRSVFERIWHAAKYAVICLQNELIGYILMLSVMRYNVAIALAVWLGAGLGYFIFAANNSILLPADAIRHNCGRRSERSASPPQDCDSVTDKLTENNDGNEDEGMWTMGTSQLPQTSVDPGVTDAQSTVPIHDENQGSTLTATVIVHREPSV